MQVTSSDSKVYTSNSFLLIDHQQVKFIINQLIIALQIQKESSIDYKKFTNPIFPPFGYCMVIAVTSYHKGK